MWIRTQNGSMLLDCNGFYFDKELAQPIIWGLPTKSTYEMGNFLGRYKSEFEANAVLDMLAERTIDPWSLDEYTNSAVFQMPPKGFMEGEG